MPMLNSGLQVWLKCTQLAFDITMLNNIFPLVKCKSIILNIPMCYAKCHDANTKDKQKKNLQKKTFLLTNSII